MDLTSEFQTPPYVASHMIGLLPSGVRTVLEPTPGKGTLARMLQERRYQVTAPEDFFLLPEARYDAIVMNPPFSGKYANLVNAPEEIQRHGMRIGYHILSECMKRSGNVVALMPMFTISDSDHRLKHLMDFGLVSITQLSRSTFNYTRIQTVILTLHQGYRGQTTYHYLPHCK